MAIDTTGKWWKGENFDDLTEYIKLLAQDGYPADHIVQSVCTCGSTTFHLFADQDAGGAKRRCVTCGTEAFIGDSAEYWDDADPIRVRCPCKHTAFELGIGFSLRESNEVKWITVGQRCVKCGVLASYVDWKIDYSPSTHLLAMV